MYKFFFLWLLPFVCFPQQAYDTLKLFNDSTTFLNERIIVTDNICNAAVRLRTSFVSGTTVEKIWFIHQRVAGDTNHYQFTFIVSVGNNPEDSILYRSNFLEAKIDYPFWDEIIVPNVSFSNYTNFYISGEILFYAAKSAETTGTNNQYLKDCDLNYWFEPLDFFWAIKVLVSSNPSSVEDYKNLKYELFPNYPNPFNPSTNIKFELPERSPVKISIYNSVGEKVEELIHSELEAGTYQLLYNAQHLTSGVYYYRMETKEKAISHKMVYVK